MKANRVTKHCEFCGEEFKVVASVSHLRKHCSRKCHFSNRTPHLPELSARQLEIITGSLLGDAHLERPRKSTHHSRFRKGQKPEHRAYQESLFEEIKPYSKTLKDYKKKRVKKVEFKTDKDEVETVCYTCSHPVFSAMRDQWYLDEKKIVPMGTVITPLVLAYWFCDDGYVSKGNNNAFICTHSFSLHEVERLSNTMKACLDLNFEPRQGKIGKDGEAQHLLYLGSRDYPSLLEMIKPYVTWDCMKHKLAFSVKKWNWKKPQITM